MVAIEKPKYPKVCAYCRGHFQGVKKAKYCTDACRVADFRRRQTERALQPVA